MPIVSGIPDSLNCSPDSKAKDSGKNFPNSGIRRGRGQPLPQGAFPWLWSEGKPGDEVEGGGILTFFAWKGRACCRWEGGGGMGERVGSLIEDLRYIHLFLTVGVQVPMRGDLIEMMWVIYLNLCIPRPHFSRKTWNDIPFYLYFSSFLFFNVLPRSTSSWSTTRLYVHTIPESFRAGTRTITNGASIHTLES